METRSFLTSKRTTVIRESVLRQRMFNRGLDGKPLDELVEIAAKSRLDAIAAMPKSMKASEAIREDFFLVTTLHPEVKDRVEKRTIQLGAKALRERVAGQFKSISTG